MPELDPLRARIAVDGGAKAAGSLRALSAQVTSTRGAFVGASAAVAALGAALVGKSIAEAVKFQSAMTGVEKTVNASKEVIAAIGEEFQALSERIPVSANELARIGEIAGQLGISTGGIVAFTETIANLGATTDLSIEEAAFAIARFREVMGTAERDLDRVGSVIVELGNNFATTEPEIVNFAQRISGAGATLGLTEAQVLGFAAALSSVGIKAEAGGTAISRVLIEMAEAVDLADDRLAVFAKTAGLSVTDFTQLFEQDAAAAVQAFITGLQGLEDEGESIFKVLRSVEFQGVRVRTL
jgi:TP901 family phage tail tape measure protein